LTNILEAAATDTPQNTEIWKAISRTNKYIDETMPWALAKSEENKARLARKVSE